MLQFFEEFSQLLMLLNERQIPLSLTLKCFGNFVVH